MGRSIHERAPCGSRDMFASPEGGRSDVNTGAIQTGGGNRSAAVKMRGNIRSGVRRYTEFGNADQANDPRLSGVVQKKKSCMFKGTFSVASEDSKSHGNDDPELLPCHG